MTVILGARRQVEEAGLLISNVLPIAERNARALHIGVLLGRPILATMLIQQQGPFDEAEDCSA